MSMSALLQRQQGFNLLELMTVTAIVSILSLVGVPKLKPMIDRTQAKTSLSQTTTAFQLARFSAVSAQQLVTVCPLDADNMCTTDWSNAITVFYDPNNTRALPSPAAIIREFPPLPFGHMKAAPASKNYFQYTAQGHSHGTIGHVRYCPDDDKAMARVVVNMTGRTRAEWLPDDTPLTC
ncbi:GspH/FimT family pseudopilin [Salinispirillum marinum]|uniref:Type II secretion system protein H n=2 Tax=Saccharospirillaceae TaxID=255527 RepID=A0ABV8BIU6_9GAMM